MSLEEKLTSSTKFCGNLLNLFLQLKYQHYYLGMENVENLEDKSMILTSNHFFSFDPFMSLWPVATKHGRLVHMLTKKENFTNPFYNFLFSHAKAYSLDRGNEWSTLIDWLSTIIDSQWVLMAPEGTRKYSGYHGPYQSGIGYFYKYSNCDIILPSFITTEIFSLRPAAFVVYGSPFEPLKDNAKKITRELYRIQGRLAVLTVDNVLSWNLVNNPTPHIDLSEQTDAILNIMNAALQDSLIIDPRLLDNGKVSLYNLEKHLHHFEKLLISLNWKIPTTSFETYMDAQGFDIDDVIYTTPSEIKQAARHFKRYSPFVYASNTIQHLNLAQYQ